MGKSLNGKELGKGISQRKDGLYQARFTNRFGKRQAVYAKTLNEMNLYCHVTNDTLYEEMKLMEKVV